MAGRAPTAPAPADPSPAEQLEQLLSLLQEGKQEEADEILRTQKELLHEACAKQDVDAVKILLKKGVSCSEWNKQLILPLHVAVNSDRLDIVTTLLKHDTHGVDRPSKFGETPLHFACMNGNLEMVKLIEKNGGDLNCVDRVGNTTLHYAVSSNNPRLVEWLLQKQQHLRPPFVNRRNQFDHTPLHRAAILKCVEVIPVLLENKAKLTSKDKNGLTPLDLATYLHRNRRGDTPIITTSSPPTKPPLASLSSSSGYTRTRSESLNIPRNPYPNFSHHTRASVGLDGSTISLASTVKRRPSITQSRRPVNLTVSSPLSYSRQVSGDSSTGSHSSIYLKDRDQATKLGRSLGRTSSYSMDELQKVVEDQTSAEPPVDMEFIPSNDQYQLHRHNDRHHSKEHNIHIRLSDRFLSSMEHRDVVEGHLVAGMSWRPGYPQHHVLISPVCFLSTKSQAHCELCVSLPHALYSLEDSNDRISIFSAPCVSSTYSPDRREMTLDEEATNITVDRTYVTFTTTLRQPTVFAVGVAVESPSFHGAPTPFDYPLLSLRCCLYIAYPSDKDKYLMSTDIMTYVGLNLRTVDQVIQKFVVPHDFIVEEKSFNLPGPVLKLTGYPENSIDDWQLSRRGTGLFKYAQIALSSETDQHATRSVTHNQSYPLKEAFFVECYNPAKALKCRIVATVDGKEVVSKLVTPYTPAPVNASAAIVMQQLREDTPSPQHDAETSSIDTDPYLYNTSV